MSTLTLCVRLSPAEHNFSWNPSFSLAILSLSFIYLVPYSHWIQFYSQSHIEEKGAKGQLLREERNRPLRPGLHPQTCWEGLEPSASRHFP